MNNKPENNSAKVAVSTPLKMKDLISYQDGAVVSKEVMKNSAGTITVFAFDEKQGLSEHSAPFDAVVTVLDGETELTIGGEKIIAKTGETVIMPANIPHAVHAPAKFKMLLVMIKGK